MKKVFTLFVIIALTSSVFAQSPQKMSYQAVVRNTSGALVTNQSVGMKISILQDFATGTAVYVETQTKTTNANGLVTLEIGVGTPVTGTFSGIAWSSGTYFIKTETDPAGGTNYTIVGTSQILSVPYALYAKTAKTADYNDLTNKPSLFDGSWTSMTGKPSFANVATSGSYNDLLNRPTLFDGTWTSITAKPTYLTGYGITDAMSISHAANNITSSNINNWNSAYGWGNHSSAGYVPSSRTITINGNTLNLSANNTWNVGTVTSVGMTLPGIFTVSGSPVTSIGTLTASLASQTANLIFASPNGTAGSPVFRALTTADIPNLDWSKITSGKPHTLAEYGITDAVTTTNAVTTSGDQTINGIKTFRGTTPDMEQALFEIKNNTGQTIFAVYNEGVRIWVADGAKGTKGGFAVQGFDKTDYMVIKPDSSNFYVREATKGVASSFNIIGIKQSQVRKSLMFARTDTVGVSGVMNLQSNLLVQGNINVTGTIYNKITDVDGNSYNTIAIGTQTWMAQNLKTTKYNDGTNIPFVPDSLTWGTLSTPAYCWYNKDEATYKETYGALYNWYTLATGKLCPSGWHIPSNTEWTTLQDYLGGQSIAGGKLKESSTIHWTTPNTGATDEAHFSALPAGARGGTGIFNNLGNYGYFWTNNGHSVDPLYAWGFVLQYNSIAVIRADYYYKRDGFSVRCLKN
jgi:uncharacterized protein (TIGR02145 family)